MVLAGSMSTAGSLGMRCAGLGLIGRTASRSALPRANAKLAPSFTGHYSNTRLFSSLLQHSRSSAVLLNLSASNAVGRNARNFWGSSKAPAPAATESKDTIAEQASAASTPASFPTETTSSTLPIDQATPAEIPVETSLLDSASDALSNAAGNVIPALQYGDLAAMGLASWSPAGLVRWSMELIHVTFSMPWLPTIVVASVFWKLVCIPFAIKGLQSAAKLQPHQAELQAMQKHMSVIKASGNTMEIQKAALRMRDFYKAHDINPLGGLVSLIQMPIQLGVFFGIKTLASETELLKSNVGVPDFMGEWGHKIMGDLTAADPTYILPALMVAFINLQIKLNIKDMNTIERPGMAHMMNAIRVGSIVLVPIFFSKLSSALAVSLLVNSVLSIVQSAVLRIHAVRHALRIPVVPKEAQGVLPSIMDTLKYPFREQTSLQAQVQSARKLAAMEQLRNKRSMK
ncbi:hypothetical protein CVT24_003838 [Panaeolus cyanescens]|uniref:Membrane insertase YidC/Oxa/ALB C-terminal domain-containing protein n=1 Tax=Panaeolus cyanescens TaxID=181874 RepID=A0A409W8F5_9AGAR|nr:hypothetical protein CVT24_003838 [Panaeolus cyanescens]